MSNNYRFLTDLKYVLNKPIQKGEQVFIADTARVFGRVTLGSQVSVWFGAVLRGDADDIVVGSGTNIQENAVIHTDPGFPAIIGEHCIIGHGAIVHGAKLDNHVLVGMHATVLNGARIGRFCLIGAHALVTENMQVPDYSLVLGSPAKVVKQLSPEQIEKIKQNAEVYIKLSAEYLKHFRMD